MPIPDYQTIMWPLLQSLSDQREHRLRETIDHLADVFGLTPEERKELLPSGKQPVFDNRVGWARTYLKKALLLEAVGRAVMRITSRGMDAVKSGHEISTLFLLQYPEFRMWKDGMASVQAPAEVPEPRAGEVQTPEEQLEHAYQRIRADLASELLDQMKVCSPSFFERLVVELLVKMGYGGSLKDAGEAIGKSGDGGVDGIIKEDRLGLDIIYIQAKRWEGVVGRPEVQKFAGALMGRKARKGVFITTSSYTKEAVEYAALIESKIVLLDGRQLAQLMIDFNLGVTRVTSYEIKRPDLDYFLDQ